MSVRQLPVSILIQRMSFFLLSLCQDKTRLTQDVTLALSVVTGKVTDMFKAKPVSLPKKTLDKVDDAVNIVVHCALSISIV